MSGENSDNLYVNELDQSSYSDNSIDKSGKKSLFLPIYSVFITIVIITLIILIFVYYSKFNNDKNDLVNSLNKTIEDYKKQIDDLKTQTASLPSKQTEIASLNAKITELNTNLNTKQTEIASLNAKITELNTNLNTKQNEIASLNAKITELNTNLNTKQNEINTYKELSDAFLPILSDITITSSNNPTNIQKINRLKEIIAGVKTQIESFGLIYNLNDLITFLNTYLSKLQTIKNQIPLNSINDINQNTLDNWFNSKINTLSADAQSLVILSQLRDMFNTPNARAGDIMTIINNIKAKIYTHIDTLLVNNASKTDVENKLDDIFTKLSLYKPYYQLLADFNNNSNRLNPTDVLTNISTNLGDYNLPSNNTNVDYTTIKSYIENSMTFLGYMSKKLSDNNTNIATLQGLKAKIDNISVLQTTITNLQAQVANLQDQLNKYLSTHIIVSAIGTKITDGNNIGKYTNYDGSVPIDKLRNVMLTNNFDFSPGATTVWVNGLSAFRIGTCYDGPSVCGVSQTERKFDTNGKEIEPDNSTVYYRNNGASKSLRIQKIGPKRYILLNQPNEIDWSTAGSEYYDENKSDKHVKLKILEDSIMTNTSLDLNTASLLGSTTPYPSCLDRGDIKEADILQIGQYGPTYNGTTNTGPWCELYKLKSDGKPITLKPKSGNMVYIKNPSVIDYSSL
jgi:cell shape-determining protein MreC